MNSFFRSRPIAAVSVLIPLSYIDPHSAIAFCQCAMRIAVDTWSHAKTRTLDVYIYVIYIYIYVNIYMYNVYICVCVCMCVHTNTIYIVGCTLTAALLVVKAKTWGGGE